MSEIGIIVDSETLLFPHGSFHFVPAQPLRHDVHYCGWGINVVFPASKPDTVIHKGECGPCELNLVRHKLGEVDVYDFEDPRHSRNRGISLGAALIVNGLKGGSPRFLLICGRDIPTTIDT